MNGMRLITLAIVMLAGAAVPSFAEGECKSYAEKVKYEPKFVKADFSKLFPLDPAKDQHYLSLTGYINMGGKYSPLNLQKIDVSGVPMDHNKALMNLVTECADVHMSIKMAPVRSDVAMFYTFESVDMRIPGLKGTASCTLNTKESTGSISKKTTVIDIKGEYKCYNGEQVVANLLIDSLRHV